MALTGHHLRTRSNRAPWSHCLGMEQANQKIMTSERKRRMAFPFYKNYTDYNRINPIYFMGGTIMEFIAWRILVIVTIVAAVLLGYIVGWAHRMSAEQWKHYNELGALEAIALLAKCFVSDLIHLVKR